MSYRSAMSCSCQWANDLFMPNELITDSSPIHDGPTAACNSQRGKDSSRNMIEEAIMPAIKSCLSTQIQAHGALHSP